MRFSKQADYKKQFNDAVTALIKEKNTDRGQGTRETENSPLVFEKGTRLHQINELINEFIAAIGERPDRSQLERLADYAMLEEITDPRPDKVTLEEYPIFSERQLMRRRGNERSLSEAEYVATDGRNYRKPTRRKRSVDELIFVDHHARIRNEKRKEQYRKDTTNGQIVSYKVEPDEIKRYLEETYGSKFK